MRSRTLVIGASLLFACASPTPPAPRAAAPTAPRETPGASPSAPAATPDLAVEPPAPSPPPPLALDCPGVPRDAAGDDDAQGAQGRIDPNPIRQVVEGHQRSFADCYERSALRDPRSGRVTVRFVIAPDGRVRRSEVADDTLSIPAVAQCLLAEVCELRFLAPVRGSVTITYPFIFDGPRF